LAKFGIKNDFGIKQVLFGEFLEEIFFGFDLNILKKRGDMKLNLATKRCLRFEDIMRFGTGI